MTEVEVLGYGRKHGTKYVHVTDIRDEGHGFFVEYTLCRKIHRGTYLIKDRGFLLRMHVVNVRVEEALEALLALKPRPVYPREACPECLKRAKKLATS